MSPRQSHPPTLIRHVQRALREEKLVERGMTILVGVSGGPDSMALLHVLSMLRSKVGFALTAHAIDHGLRPEATQEIALARDFCHQFDVAFGVTQLQVAPGGNLQARARAQRLAALRQAARANGAERIALGHHADDRAETVLIRLLRGSGPAGLAVLPPRSNDLIRPLLRARRSDVMAHLQRHHIPFAQDPSNDDLRFLRARIRGQLLPMLVSLSPSIVQHLCNLADDMAALGLSSTSLARAQLRELGRAASRHRAGVRVSVPGGGVAMVDMGTGRIVVQTPEEMKGTRKPRQRPKDA
ncbi:MAG TPA: tRNA lysidine(34) synthetase TilS [Polyangiaceae bacterium]|nr:tRNA lysidine(34) synthetase TilS [Polyangiaceae bacterium]HNZ25067.1 tRNA lysidine(34) synthetase TilS [Polyangiaceae bacterium]HOD24421.1 tRNA lysidine(34) synthetase TilS [Polyangiaceae bacterium]HOE49937.1 tRNA lysidine(34) synthetase TilS [Polyangiaceae bacterium]HOH03132.1 tRNA lysidine(34) synthetase TilS [Polyangiaceae bacterium]